MSEIKLIDQIQHLDPCREAVEWIGDRSLDEAWQECVRGDWMLWLYEKAANFDHRKAAYVAALCANDVRHLMPDIHCHKAVDVALAYGRGEVDDGQLMAARAAAYAAADDAAAYAAADAADAAYAAARAAAYAAADNAANAAAYAAADAADAAYEAYAADAAYEAYAADARNTALMRYAELCREHLPTPKL